MHSVVTKTKKKKKKSQLFGQSCPRPVPVKCVFSRSALPLVAERRAWNGTYGRELGWEAETLGFVYSPNPAEH